MAWSEIKKAVNSDISTPLNTLITNLISQVKSYISTAGSVKVVRRVQRGIANVNIRVYEYTNTDAVTITLSGFNDSSKMQVTLNGGVNTQVSDSDSTYIQSVFVASLSPTSLTLKKSSGSPRLASSLNVYVSYEVIEFY